nr:MAG TPA: hypothetical protein [Caudoviricetes sp.]
MGSSNKINYINISSSLLLRIFSLRSVSEVSRT